MASFAALGQLLLWSFVLLSGGTVQAACPHPVAQSVANPLLANGLVAKVVATGLQNPRGILFDKGGHLLVVEVGKGVSALTLRDDGGSCLSVKNTTTVVKDSSLNHGLQLGSHGYILYASNVEAVYSYPYYPFIAETHGTRQTIVNGMTNTDHATRTMLISAMNPEMMVVNRGSQANIDPLASFVKNGHAQVKAFDLSKINGKTYNFTTSGELLAWGVRNSVGIGEEPVQGRIYTVENSLDNIQRDGQDVHDRNPGEKLNFLGYVNGKTSPNTGTNFGYPKCFATWDASELPNNQALDTGIQFARQGAGVTDAFCQKNRTAPRLTFNAHMAPLDIKWDTSGSTAYISFHGSFDRPQPEGYKISNVKFAGGDPIAPTNSKTAAIDIVSNPDVSQCNGGTTCFRPVSIAFDAKGRMFFSSDATGEIWAVSRSDGKPLVDNPVV